MRTIKYKSNEHIEQCNEHIEQCKLITWKWLSIKRFPELKNLFAIPNGGMRDIITGAKLKSEGVLAGVPDLFLAVPRGNYHGLFVEMKVKPNKPTVTQREVMTNLREQTYAVIICYSAAEAITAIENYFKN